MRAILLLLLALLATGIFRPTRPDRPAPPDRPDTYTVREITLPLCFPREQTVLPRGVNARGQVAVNANSIGSGIHTRGFLWKDGVPRDLGDLPEVEESEALALNDKGQVVGYAYNSIKAPSFWHAFLWSNGTMRDLGTLGGERSEAYGLNETGQVVGWSEVTRERPKNRPMVYHAFLWEKGMMRDLGVPLGTHSEAHAINRRGQVAGSSYRIAMVKRGVVQGWEPDGQAVLWEGSKARLLGTLGGKSSQAFDLNERGQVVGRADTGPATKTQAASAHGFLWEKGKMRDLGTLGGRNSEALAVNNRGHVVGWSETGAKDAEGLPDRRAFCVGPPARHARPELPHRTFRHMATARSPGHQRRRADRGGRTPCLPSRLDPACPLAHAPLSGQGRGRAMPTHARYGLTIARKDARLAVETDRRDRLPGAIFPSSSERRAVSSGVGKADPSLRSG